MSTERDRLRKWLQDILEAHDIAASELARRAGLAPSTLTRFLADDDAPLLSTRTVAKITAAARTGASGPATFAEAPTPRFDTSQADTALARAIAAILAERPQAYVTRLADEHDLAALGYAVGDYLFVDPADTPEAGQIACAQTFDWQTNTAVTVHRLFEPPYLIGGTLTGARRKPLIVDNDHVVLRGRVFASLRWLD